MAAAVDDALLSSRDRRFEMRRSLNQQQSSMMGRNRALSMVAPAAALVAADPDPAAVRGRTRAGAMADSPKSRSASDPHGDAVMTRGRSRTTVGGGPGQKCLVVEIRSENSEKPRQRPDSRSMSANESSMFDVEQSGDMPPPPNKPAPAPPTQAGAAAQGVQQAETPVRCRSLSYSPAVYKPNNFSAQLEGLRGIIQASITSSDAHGHGDDSYGRARASTVMSGTSDAVLLDLKEKFKDLSQRLSESEGRAENLAKQLRIERNLRQDLEAKVKELKAELKAAKGQ